MSPPSRAPPSTRVCRPRSFDLVTVAQAWHWCDPRLASAEIARILRPHGVLGLIWNQLDTAVPWVHRLSRIMHAGDVLKPHFRPPVGPEFTGLESHLTRWEDSVTTEDITELTKSRSYYLAASASTRDKVMANLDWYLHEHLGHAPGDSLRLPYRDLAGLPDLTLRGTDGGTPRRVPSCYLRVTARIARGRRRGLLFRYA